MNNYLFELIRFIINPYVFLLFLGIIFGTLAYKFTLNIMSFVIVYFLFIFFGFIYGIFPLWFLFLFIIIVITFGILDKRVFGGFRI